MPENPKRSFFNTTISSHLVERYLFNFRVAPEVLTDRIPISWLKPRIVNGFSVVSFCILKLEHVTLKPLPSLLGLRTTSCAYRCSVTDISGRRPQPSVYIPNRSTDLALVSRLSPTVFSGSMPLIQTSITHASNSIEIRANSLDGKSIFSAKVKPRFPDKLSSKLFDSFGDLVDFIKEGVSSYTPSTQENCYSRVDLDENSTYEPIDASVDYSCIDDAWRDLGLVFDSALRARGGHYNLMYVGRVPALSDSPVAIMS